MKRVKLLPVVLVIAVILALVIALILIFSPKDEKDRSYNEDEVLSAARELIPKTEMLNLVYWGAGIDHVDDESTANGYYYEANILHLEKLGFKTIEELKELTRASFSEDLCESIFSTSLTSVSDDNGIQSYARYYQKYVDDDSTERPYNIMVYTKARVLLTDEVVYHYDTLEVESVKGQVVYVTLMVTVTRGEESQTRPISVGLIEEECGWRLNDATYISYDPTYTEQ